MNNDRILLAVDASERASSATELCTTLAERSDATVDVLPTADREERGAAGPSRSTHGLGGAPVPDELRARIDALEDTEIHTVDQAPHKTIPRVADRTGTDMVVLGCDSDSSVRGWFRDGVVDRVLESASVPVLTVPDGADPTSFGRALVPANRTLLSDAAVDRAASAAADLSESVVVTYVINLYVEAGPFNAGGVTEEFIENKNQEAEPAVRRITDRVRERISDLETEIVAEASYPHEIIADRSRERGIGCVIVSKSENASLVQRVMGGPTKRVLRDANVPVLVVPGTDGKHPV